MIYERVRNEDPIHQGDIFLNVPLVDLSCEYGSLDILDGNEEFIKKSLASLISASKQKFPTLAELTFVPRVF
jgi:hypothetical protein